MARESGIQIARYQNPLDLSKTTTKADQNTTSKLVKSGTDLSSNDENTTGLQLLPQQQQKPMKTAITTLNTDGNTSVNINSSKSISFQDIIQQSPKSDLHSLPVTHQQSITNQTMTKQPSQKQPSKSSLKQPKTAPTPTITAQTSITTKPIGEKSLPIQQLNQPENGKKTSDKINVDGVYNGSGSNDFITTDNDDEYSPDERKERAAGFYEVIETKLIPQLQHYQTRREKIARTLHELEQLLDSIRGLQLAQQHGAKTMESKVDLGCKVLAEAKFVNTGQICIDVGFGIFTEMPYDSAINVIKQRCELLKPNLAHCENQCCLYSSRIKGVHEAIGVLTSVSDQPEEREPLRDVWFQ
jgi:prefoldin subunit 5